MAISVYEGFSEEHAPEPEHEDLWLMRWHERQTGRQIAVRAFRRARNSLSERMRYCDPRDTVVAFACNLRELWNVMR